MIDQQLAAFLEDGVGVHLGTRDADLLPNGARAVALKVEPDGKHVLVLIARVAAERLLSDLQSNGQAAITVARPTDERACQVKGRFVGVRPLNDAERAHARAQWAAFVDNLEYIGIPRISSQTWISTPDLAIRLKVSDVFDQTPGPDAGKTLA